MSSKHERWAPVLARYYRDVYEVSTLGRIRRVIAGSRTPAGYLLKCGGRAKGYPMVVLQHRGRSAGFTVHRLVLEAFVGRRPRGKQSRHLNGNRYDNRLVNLKWGTPRENGQDRIRHGTARGAVNPRRGETHPKARLTMELAREIRRLRSGGFTYRALMGRFDLSMGAVTKVCAEITWRDG